jgi:transposase
MSAFNRVTSPPPYKILFFLTRSCSRIAAQEQRRAWNREAGLLYYSTAVCVFPQFFAGFIQIKTAILNAAQDAGSSAPFRMT